MLFLLCFWIFSAILYTYKHILGYFVYIPKDLKKSYKMLSTFCLHKPLFEICNSNRFLDLWWDLKILFEGRKTCCVLFFFPAKINLAETVVSWSHAYFCWWFKASWSREKTCPSRTADIKTLPITDIVNCFYPFVYWWDPYFYFFS